jgi:hypothetical protein
LQFLVGSGGFIGQIALLRSFQFPVSKPREPEAGNLKLETGHHGYATFAILMAPNPQTEPDPEPLYCPRCAQEVNDPLTCGDCSSVICRRCGTPLESPDELGMG